MVLKKSLLQLAQYDSIKYFCTHRIQVDRGNGVYFNNYSSISPSKIRNIGVIAHVDAGKTTVTERLLYLSGTIKRMGDVDSGTTVTDFMDLERERGITIQSAAVTFFWRNHRINLIDTPGHVDFTLEVERCVRVLDGAIIVLDGSTGVQAQTMTVWRQAKKFHLPSIFFINKMDKNAADFRKSVESIKMKLEVQNAVPINIPVYDDNGSFSGVIDLINKKYLNINSNETEWENISETNRRFDEMVSGREKLLANLADIDEPFAEIFLAQPNKQTLKESLMLDKEISNAIRRATLSRCVVPIICGTALRCAASALPVLDGVVDYLPSPLERNQSISSVFGDHLSALIFKIRHDTRMGQLGFVRVYTGELKNGSAVYNSTRNFMEHKIRIFVPHSDELKPTSVVKAGNIAVISGLQQTFTGDTLVENEHAARIATKNYHKLMQPLRRKNRVQNQSHDLLFHHIKLNDGHLKEDVKYVQLAGIQTPDPVFFCTIEPPDNRSIVNFQKALNEIIKEDPSVHVRNDGDFGQTILQGMGELHMQVIKDRLVRDYGLNVFMGPMQISYREILLSSICNTATVSAVFGEPKIKHECTITLEMKPKQGVTKFNGIHIAVDDPSFIPIRSDWLDAINLGCGNALLNGPIMGHPVYDVSIFLKQFVTSGGRLSTTVITACASKCIHDALKIAQIQILEPVMFVEVTIKNCTPEQSMHGILSEITRRRGSILGIDEEGKDSHIRAVVPCSAIQGMVKSIRIASSGLADIHMQMQGYKNVTSEELKEILNKCNGTW